MRFYHFVSARPNLGADYFINVAEGLQQGVFVPVYLNIVLSSTQSLVRPIDRKSAVVSLTKTLCDSEAFVVKYGNKGWGFTCDALLKLLENPPVMTKSDEGIVEADVDDLSFGVGFTQLNTCKKPPRDDWADIVDVKSWVGKTLKEADAKHQGRIGKMVQEKLTPEAQTVLMSYMS